MPTLFSSFYKIRNFKLIQLLFVVVFLVQCFSSNAQNNVIICVGEVTTLTTNCPPANSNPWTDNCSGIISNSNGQITGLSAGACTVSYAGLYGYQANFSITVISQTSISQVSPIGTENQTITTAVPIQPIEYQITGKETDLYISSGGFPEGVTGEFINGIYTISGTPIEDGVFNYSLSMNNPNCGFDGNIQTGTITSFTSSICLGSTTTLSNLTLGGNWSSQDNSIASVSNIGVVTGLNAGVCLVDYTDLSSTVTSYSINVTAPFNLDPITGQDTLCIYSYTNLLNSLANGDWSSSNPTIVTVSNTGEVTGLNNGTATINYSVSSGGCTASTSIPVFVESYLIYDISLTSATGTDLQTLPVHNLSATYDTMFFDTLIDITYSFAGAAGVQLVGALPAGLTTNFSNGVFTITGRAYQLVSNLATSTLIYDYEIVPVGFDSIARYCNGGNCSACGPGIGIDTTHIRGRIIMPPACVSRAIPVNLTVCAYEFWSANSGISMGDATGVIFSGIGASYSSNQLSGILDPGTYPFTIMPTGGSCIPIPSDGLIVVLPPVTPIFTAIPNVCQNSAAPVLPTVSNNYINGTWSPAVSTTTIGTTTYTFTPSPGQCATMTTNTITVIPQPMLYINNVSICEGDVAILNAYVNYTDGSTNSFGGVYSWSDGGANLNSHTITPGVTNFYNCVFTDNNGCSASAGGLVTVNQKPIVDAGETQTICPGTETVLEASGALTYQWNNGVSDGVAFIPSVGTNTYTVTGTNAYGCVGYDTVDVVVQSSPDVNAGIDQTICLGSSVILSATTSSISDVVFDWNDGVLNGVPFTPSLGTNMFIVNSTNTTTGCESSDQVVVSVVENPIVNAGEDVIVCHSYLATLSGSGADSYSWNNGVVDGVSFIPSTGTVTYIVIGTDANGCTGTDSMNILFENPPIASFTYTIGSGGQVQFTNTSTGSNLTYLWSSGNGIASVEENPTFLYGNNGPFTPVLTVTNDCGSNTTSGIVDVNGIQEITKLSNLIFPNPFENEISIQLKKMEQLLIEVYDISGKLLYKESYVTDLIKLNLEFLESGHYLLKCSNGINSETNMITKK